MPSPVLWPADAPLLCQNRRVRGSRSRALAWAVLGRRLVLRKTMAGGVGVRFRSQYR